MPKAKITKKVEGDITTIEVIEYVPDKSELNFTNHLPSFADARDVCGDGTEEYLHNDPLAVWKQFPVKYFIENSISDPVFINGIQDSFEEFNLVADSDLYERTLNPSEAKIRISMEQIDSPGRTLARATWSWRSGLELINGTITFDSNESWEVLDEESCGAIGSVFDLLNVGVHEVGHLSGLAHAPTDPLQTMFATTSPGKTLGRTLGNGDIKGFEEAYDLITPPLPPPSPPSPPPIPSPIPPPMPPPPTPPPPINEPPTAESFGVTIEQNESIVIELKGLDPENRPLMYDILTTPSNGKVVNIGLAGETVQYTPNTGFSGLDSFQYVAIDDIGQQSNAATVTITVKPKEEEPEPEPCVRPELPRRPTLEQIFAFVALMIEYIRCRQNQR